MDDYSDVLCLCAGNPRVHPAVSVRPATLLETPPVDHKSVTSVVSTGARSAATVPSSAASAIEAGRRPFDASPQPEDDDDGFDSDSTDSETANITRQALRRDTGAAHRTSLTATRPRRSPAEAVTTRLASSKPSF